jgi:hypothetical protein
MAKLQKVKWGVSAILTETVPDGEKPLKKKDILALLPNSISDVHERITEGKIKVVVI